MAPSHIRPPRHPIMSLSTPFDQANCLSVESNCNAFGASTDSCVSAYTLSDALQSCWCQATILDLASRCEIDGSVSCLLQTPTTTNLWSYSHCRGSTMNLASTSAISTTVILTSQPPATSTALSPSSTASTVTATATPASKSSASHISLKNNWLLLLSLGLAVGKDLLRYD
jgi:hypothetical protein